MERIRESRFTKPAALGLAALVGLSLFLVFAMRSHAVTAELSFNWTMQERYKDTDNDGVLNESLAPAYANPSSWNVTFDACTSPAATANPGATYFWTFTNGGSTVNSSTACSVTPSLPKLGTWQV